MTAKNDVLLFIVGSLQVYVTFGFKSKALVKVVPLKVQSWAKNISNRPIDQIHLWPRHRIESALFYNINF